MSLHFTVEDFDADEGIPVIYRYDGFTNAHNRFGVRKPQGAKLLVAVCVEGTTDLWWTDGTKEGIDNLVQYYKHWFSGQKITWHGFKEI